MEVPITIMRSLLRGFLLFPIFHFALVSPASAFLDAFDRSGALEETGSMSSSASPDWWLNSGGRVHWNQGAATTVVGSLPVSDPWRLLYAASSPVDTDGGYHPQNLLRLVTRGRWQSFRQELAFRILATNLSASPERNAWSGVLLFHRYLDGQNLYYAGIRMDGAAVIKKKIHGTYYTLAFRKIYPGTYDRSANPTLLPQRHPIRLRTVIEDTPTGSVRLRLEILDETLGTGWISALEAEDAPGGADGDPIVAPGYAGIRTDFMDVAFDEFEAIPALGDDSTTGEDTTTAPGLDTELLTAPASGAAPQVDGQDRYGAPSLGFLAYGRGFTGGVRLARCDVDGDGVNEIVTVPGPGGGPHVRVLRVAADSGAAETAAWFAYARELRSGLFVACGDLDGDGKEEVVTGTDAGTTPLVRVFAVEGAGARLLQSFLAYAPGFRAGVRVEACDTDGDGRDEIVTGPGFGGGPHVRIFSAVGSVRLLTGFFAYSRTFRGGVTVACGDLDGDGREDIVTGTASRGAPQVRFFRVDGSGVRATGSFLAYARSLRTGVRVAACDFDRDGRSEVVTGPGPGSAGEVRTYAADGAVRVLSSFAVAPSAFTGGVEVACGLAT